MASLALTLQRYSRGWRGDLVALLAGAATPLAFAPIDWWPLAIVSTALLFTLWLFSDVRRATWRGFWFGLGLFGVGINWVFISIYFHGFVNLGLSIFLTALLIVVMALYLALLGYLVARFFPVSFEKRYTRLKLLLVMPAAWVMMEWLRGWLFTGFPWLNLGYAQTDSLFAGWAPIAGVYGVSWIVAISAALLIALILDRAGRLFYSAGLIIVVLLSLQLDKTYWTESHGAPVKATLLQGNIPQDLKWHPDVRRPTIEQYTEMTRENWDSDLIVWPETALPAFYYEVEYFLEDLEYEAKQTQTDLLIGMLTQGESPSDYYNTMMSLGSSRGQYHKDHLVPFTEYLPFKSILGGLVKFMQVPMSDFSRGGDSQAPLNVARQHAGISICFEDAFGEEVIRALPDATFLVNVSNDAWFDDSWAPPQHLQMARMRALETERPLLRATNTGMTAIIGAKGEIKVQAPKFEIATITETIQPRTGSTPYVFWGNWFVVSVVLLVLLGAYRLRAKGVGL